LTPYRVVLGRVPVGHHLLVNRLPIQNLIDFVDVVLDLLGGIVHVHIIS